MIVRRNKTAGALASVAAALLLAQCAAAGAEGFAVANLPAPGTYTLPRIQQTPDAPLLDANGTPTTIAARTRGAVTALGLFYAHCEDPRGCPVAWSVFEAIRKEASRDRWLAERLRLLFVSIDPERDTPAAMRLLETAEQGGAGDVPWFFLTSASALALAPFLRAMGQDVAYDIDDAGLRTGVIQHMLKVFLIDPDGWVREIYSTAFLTPETLLNDARTIAMAFPNASARDSVR